MCWHCNSRRICLATYCDQRDFCIDLAFDALEVRIGDSSQIIILHRLQTQLDPYLHHTQYGFRPNGSTTTAIHCLCRVVDYTEQGTQPLQMLSSIEPKHLKNDSIIKLVKSLRDLVPDALTRQVHKLYTNPTFCISVHGYISSQRMQETGIRQGCPLSPFSSHGFHLCNVFGHLPRRPPFSYQTPC